MHAGRVLVGKSQLPQFEKRLRVLNDKAERFGLSPITVASMAPKPYVYEGQDDGSWHVRPQSRRDVEDMKPSFTVMEIELEYPDIKLGDWQVIGKLEAVDTGKNLRYSYSRDQADERAVSGYAEACIECEHCNAKRARKEAYILKNVADGAFKEVGTSCLEDFTGIDPKALLFMQRLDGVMSGLEDELGAYGGSAANREFLLQSYLAVVSYLTESRGFVSKAKARDEPGQVSTADNAAYLLSGVLGAEAAEEWRKFLRVADRHREVADKVIQWVRGREADPHSSFDQNLKILFENDQIATDTKRLAFAAAAVPSYYRAQSKALEREQRKPSEHIGAPGEKMATELRLLNVSAYTTSYGVTHVVLMEDRDGNKVVWKTGACPQEFFDHERGDRLSAKFTVKEHSTYRDESQTTVLRLKAEEWLEPEVQAARAVVEEPEPEPEPEAGFESCTLSVTYELVTDESAAAGDAAERGYEIRSETFDRAALAELAGARGYVRPSSEGLEAGMWFSTVVPELDDGPDGRRFYALHLEAVDGRTPALRDYAQLARLLGAHVASREHVATTPDGQRYSVETPST